METWVARTKKAKIFQTAVTVHSARGGKGNRAAGRESKDEEGMGHDGEEAYL